MIAIDKYASKHPISNIYAFHITVPIFEYSPIIKKIKKNIKINIQFNFYSNHGQPKNPMAFFATYFYKIIMRYGYGKFN
jgi:hypothetical protein